jgi:hypothetical protein
LCFEVEEPPPETADEGQSEPDAFEARELWDSLARRVKPSRSNCSSNPFMLAAAAYIEAS